MRGRFPFFLVLPRSPPVRAGEIRRRAPTGAHQKALGLVLEKDQAQPVSACLRSMDSARSPRIRGKFSTHPGLAQSTHGPSKPIRYARWIKVGQRVDPVKPYDAGSAGPGEEREARRPEPRHRGGCARSPESPGAAHTARSRRTSRRPDPGSALDRATRPTHHRPRSASTGRRTMSGPRDTYPLKMPRDSAISRPQSIITYTTWRPRSLTGRFPRYSARVWWLAREWCPRPGPTMGPAGRPLIRPRPAAPVPFLHQRGGQGRGYGVRRRAGPAWWG